jgi:signal transduction histidine kinase
LVNYVCKYAQEYLAVAGLRYRLDAPPQLPATPISPEVRHNVFLAAKEAVTNVVRHARATEACLRVWMNDATLNLEIQDNGRGPGGADQPAASSRNGLRNMRKRMEDVGGGFAITAAPGGGAVVRLTVPVNDH